jgi:hypothetical protein
MKISKVTHLKRATVNSGQSPATSIIGGWPIICINKLQIDADTSKSCADKVLPIE